MKRATEFIMLLLPLAVLCCGDNARDAAYTGVLEGKTVHVPALIGGKILQISAEEGREVAEGDTLAVVDTAEWVLQRRQLEAAVEELAVGQEIVRTDLRRTKTDLDYMTEKYERIKMLYEKQAMPKQNLDDLKNQVQRARSAHDAARKQVRSLEAKGRQLGVQIETVQKKISDAVVVAPIAGLVATRYFEPGEAIPPLQAIVELIHIRELEVKIYIPERKLPEVKHGQEVDIRVDGLEGALKGRIIWVSPRAEFTPKTILTPETRTSLVYAVKIAVPNPERILKHGMPVEVVWMPSK